MKEKIIDFGRFSEKPVIICGLMTGTSVDGIDTALVKFDIAGSKHSMEIIAGATFDFTPGLKKLISKLIAGRGGIEDVSLLHYALPLFYAESVDKICNSAGIDKKALDAIGMHGQTIYHDPAGKVLDGRKISSTFQAGSVSALAKLSGILTVGDFRSGDIALGGQGAPLVPVFDYEFLRSTEQDVIALNIGGIANITYIPADSEPDNVKAFDTGPGNTLIDILSDIYFGQSFDRGGGIARSGKLIEELFSALKEEPFIYKKPPKSTGRELFNMAYISSLTENKSEKYRPEDIIRTFTEFTAWSIAENIRNFASATSRIIVSGGGAHNIFLLELLRAFLPGSEVILSDEAGIPSLHKEAVCFAYQALLTLLNRPGNLKSATGAAFPTTLGLIALP